MRAWIVLPLLVVSTAHADVESARDDIVDMRKGRMPNRVAALGWTEQGAYVYRETECNWQDVVGMPACHVTIYVADRRRTQAFPLFSAEWSSECADTASSATCYAITTEAASAFLAAERKVMADLGTLTPGTAIGRDAAGGKLSVIRYEDEPADRRRAALALVKGGRWKPLRILWSVESGKDEFLRGNPLIERVERSPDGETLAVVTQLSHAEDDFWWTTRGITLVPTPR